MATGFRLAAPPLNQRGSVHERPNMFVVHAFCGSTFPNPHGQQHLLQKFGPPTLQCLDHDYPWNRIMCTNQNHGILTQLALFIGSFEIWISKS